MSVSFSLEASSDGFEVSIAESFENILTTPKETVVMLPEFGTDFNELIDRDIDDEWLIDFRRVVTDASKWEKRKKLIDLQILRSNPISGSVSVKFMFADSSFMQGSLNGF